jgi:hypothetical protein
MRWGRLHPLLRGPGCQLGPCAEAAAAAAQLGAPCEGAGAARGACRPLICPGRLDAFPYLPRLGRNCTCTPRARTRHTRALRQRLHTPATSCRPPAPRSALLRVRLPDHVSTGPAAGRGQLPAAGLSSALYIHLLWTFETAHAAGALLAAQLCCHTPPGRAPLPGCAPAAAAAPRQQPRAQARLALACAACARGRRAAARSTCSAPGHLGEWPPLTCPAGPGPHDCGGLLSRRRRPGAPHTHTRAPWSRPRWRCAPATKKRCTTTTRPPSLLPATCASQLARPASRLGGVHWRPPAAWPGPVGPRRLPSLPPGPPSAPPVPQGPLPPQRARATCRGGGGRRPRLEGAARACWALIRGQPQRMPGPVLFLAPPALAAGSWATLAQAAMCGWRGTLGRCT